MACRAVCPDNLLSRVDTTQQDRALCVCIVQHDTFCSFCCYKNVKEFWLDANTFFITVVLFVSLLLSCSSQVVASATVEKEISSSFNGSTKISC